MDQRLQRKTFSLLYSFLRKFKKMEEFSREGKKGIMWPYFYFEGLIYKYGKLVEDMNIYMGCHLLIQESGRKNKNKRKKRRGKVVRPWWPNMEAMEVDPKKYFLVVFQVIGRSSLT